MEELEYYNATKNGVTVTIKQFSPKYDFFTEYGTKFRYALHHKYMDLGQYDYSLDQPAYKNWEEYGHTLENSYKPPFMSPIYMYQVAYREPVKLSTKPFKNKFHSMQVGFAFIEQDTLYDFCQENGLELPDPESDDYEQSLIDVTENYLKPLLEKEVTAYEMDLNDKVYTVQVNDKTYGPFFIPEWINEKTQDLIPQEFVEDIKEAQRLRIEAESY